MAEVIVTLNGVQITGGTTGAKLIKAGRGMGPEVNVETIEIPDMPGAYLGNISLKPRSLPLVIQVVGTSYSDYMTKLSTLAPIYYAGVMQKTPAPVPMTFSDEPGETYYVLLSGTTNMDQTAKMGEGTIVFLMLDPFKYGSNIPVAMAFPTTTLTNVGSATMLPVITVNFTHTCSDFKIAHRETGRFIRVIKSFLVSDVLVIDCRTGKITVNGVLSMTTLDINSDIVNFEIWPGVNNFDITMTGGGTATGSLTYDQRWLA